MLLHNNELWVDIFRDHISDVSKFLNKNSTPSFSIYRTPYDAMQASPMNDREDSQYSGNTDLFLHILYMKSDEKTLTRNYNAEQLELFCHNRFYGPLVVAFNASR